MRVEKVEIFPGAAMKKGLFKTSKRGGCGDFVEVFLRFTTSYPYYLLILIFLVEKWNKYSIK